MRCVRTARVSARPWGATRVHTDVCLTMESLNAWGGGVRDSGALGQDRSSRRGLTVPVSSPFSELLLPGGWEAKQGNVRSTKLRKPYDFVLPQVPTLPSEDAVGHSPTL